MPTKEEFIQTITAGYTFKGEAVQIGAAVLNGEVIPKQNIVTAKNHEPTWVDSCCYRYR